MEKGEGAGKGYEFYSGSVHAWGKKSRTIRDFVLGQSPAWPRQGRRRERALPGGPDPSASGRGEEGSAG
jgi:hypothetical protein